MNVHSQSGETSGPAELPIELEHGNGYSPESGTLRCGWNAGFFSNCTVTLWSLLALLRARRPVKRIDFSQAFSRYRDPAPLAGQTDLYPFFFTTRPADAAALQSAPILGWGLGERGYQRHPDHHSVYRFLNYRVYRPYVRAYFEPSAEVKSILAGWERKYHLSYGRLVAVCYRGTDKWKEVALADPSRYLEATRRLLAREKEFKVLIQTDQASVRKAFQDEFGSRCLCFEEMPASEDGISLDRKPGTMMDGSRVRWAQALLAATIAVSRCRLIVNHTGNMALWICLFRGNADGMLQFAADGGQIATFTDAVAAQYQMKRWTFLAPLVRRLAPRSG